MEIIKGDFGMNACMESVKQDVEKWGKNPFDLLREYQERAKTDIFFNKRMIEAVEEYIRINNLVEEVEEQQQEEQPEEEKQEETKDNNKWQPLNDIALLWKAWKKYGKTLYYKDLIDLDTYYRIINLLNRLEGECLKCFLKQ